MVRSILKAVILWAIGDELAKLAAPPARVSPKLDPAALDALARSKKV